MVLNPHLWPILACAAVGVAITAGAWFVLLRRRATVRRRRLWTALAVVLTAACVVNLDAWLIEPESLVLRRVDVVKPDWRGAPLTIAAIGDTHVGGPHMDVARMDRIVQRINALQPELVVLLGDYIHGHSSRQRRTEDERTEAIAGITSLAALHARLGVVAVIGNHDVWFDREAVTQALEAAGIVVLWNRNIVLHRPGGEVVIAGIADAMTGHPDFATALAGAPPGADAIVISHSPVPFMDIPAGPPLMLAAHTHCGQVTIPFVGRPILPIEEDELACGRIDRGAQTLYVTAGLGTSIAPLRFGNPPEIALITIHGAGPPAR